MYRPFVLNSWVSFETDPPTEAEMARRIADYGASHGWLVAEDGDTRLAGFCYASPHRARSACATSVDVALSVDPRHARQGVGAALYGALFPQLAQRGVHAVFAGIALPNAASVGLHEAMGFTPVGVYREVGRKLDEWRDVGWWQRVL